jgi:hypothetical protein
MTVRFFDNTGSKLIDSVLIVGIATVLSYVIAYLSEVGYLAYYNIGSDLAQPQYKFMLQYAPLLTLCITLILILIQLTILWTNTIKNRWLKLFSFNFLAAIYIAILAFAIPGPKFSGSRFYEAFGAIFYTLSILLLIYWLIYLLDKYIIWLRKPIRYLFHNWQKIKLQFAPQNKNLTLLFILSYGLLLLASYPVSIGYYMAQRTTLMPVIYTYGQTLAVVRQYENYWLAVEYDIPSQTVKIDTYHYMPVKDTGGFELKMAKIKQNK